MNYERQKRLVERLLDKTRAGELSWQEGVFSNVFQADFPSNSVQIRLIEGGRSNDFQVYIVDSNGRATDTFDDSDLNRDGPHPSASWHSILEEIFVLARRKALKADEAIDSILAEIG